MQGFGVEGTGNAQLSLDVQDYVLQWKLFRPIPLEKALFGACRDVGQLLRCNAEAYGRCRGVILLRSLGNTTTIISVAVIVSVIVILIIIIFKILKYEPYLDPKQPAF